MCVSKPEASLAGLQLQEKLGLRQLLCTGKRQGGAGVMGISILGPLIFIAAPS